MTDQSYIQPIAKRSWTGTWYLYHMKKILDGAIKNKHLGGDYIRTHAPLILVPLPDTATPAAVELHKEFKKTQDVHHTVINELIIGFEYSIRTQLENLPQAFRDQGVGPFLEKVTEICLKAGGKKTIDNRTSYLKEVWNIKNEPKESISEFRDRLMNRMGIIESLGREEMWKDVPGILLDVFAARLGTRHFDLNKDFDDLANGSITADAFKAKWGSQTPFVLQKQEASQAPVKKASGKGKTSTESSVTPTTTTVADPEDEIDWSQATLLLLHVVEETSPSKEKVEPKKEPQQGNLPMNVPVGMAGMVRPNNTPGKKGKKKKVSFPAQQPAQGQANYPQFMPPQAQVGLQAQQHFFAPQQQQQRQQERQLAVPQYKAITYNSFMQGRRGVPGGGRGGWTPGMPNHSRQWINPRMQNVQTRPAHLVMQEPWFDSNNHIVGMMSTRITETKKQPLVHVFDTGAGLNVWTTETLLQEIVEGEPVSISTANGTQVCSTYGLHSIFGWGVISPGVNVNLVSHGRLEKEGFDLQMTKNQDGRRSFVLSHPKLPGVVYKTETQFDLPVLIRCCQRRDCECCAVGQSN